MPRKTRVRIELSSWVARCCYGNKYMHVQSVTRDHQADFGVSSSLLFRRLFLLFFFLDMVCYIFISALDNVRYRHWIMFVIGTG